jgi:hypothetical protein
MYKASRKFIESRQKYSPGFRLTIPNSVAQLGTGEPNQCFLNSRGFVKDKKEQGEHFVSLSGLLVSPYNKLSDSTEIVQHWWVGDMAGKHFDTTLHISENLEYILDMEIYGFAFKNYERIRSCVAISILEKSSRYYLLRDAKTLELDEISEFKTELLFEYI